LFNFFFFQAEDGIRDRTVTGVQTCALPISYSFAITPDGARAYVANEYALSLSVIDLGTNSIIKNMAYIGAYPYGVAIQPPAGSRSEERRVGKECRDGVSPYQ